MMTLRELIRTAALVNIVAMLSTAGAEPHAITQPHWAVTSTLNGMAGPNGLPSTAWFDWGPTRGYGQRTAPFPVGDSAGVVRVTAVLSNLMAGQIYHARLVVSNSAGVAFGMDQPLVTPGQVKVSLLGSGIGGCCSPFPFPTPRPCGAPPDTCNDGTPEWKVPPGLTNIVAVSGRGLMLRADGTVIGVSNTLTNVVAISGGFPSMGLRADGTVLLEYGNVPPHLTDVIAVSTSGGPHHLALRQDGTVVAWGNENSGLTTNLPPGLSNIVAISAGYSHSLALRMDGTVVAWGSDISGLTSVPGSLTNVVSVAAGLDVNLALRSDGKVVAWPDPWGEVASGLSNVVAIAASCTAFALVEDGTVIQWRPGFHMKYLTNIVTIAAVAEGRPNLALGANQAPVNYWAPLSFELFQNRDSILTFWGTFDQNGDNFHVRIATLPRSGSLYQLENGTRGAAINAPGTLVTDPGGRVILAPEEGGDLDARFTFIANDGELDSAPVGVALSIAPAFPRIRLDRWNCHSSIRFVGETNRTYRIWESTNLADWRVLGSASADYLDGFHFTTADGAVSARFFKVSTP